ncbi:hypothetical protein HHK36_021211 [Tetracentron sinense]|uniref:UBA domain-containing protein n=1 Tax=Tetracentron sinense TaxID=13715 RepID=A0A834YTG7_TETSI|nr:hypothetical protein HHK36_021211 [Tetracentron sinense]
MAAGCLHYEDPGKALWVIQEMKKVGIDPNEFTLAIALRASSNLAYLEEGEKAHCLSIKVGDDVGVCVHNAWGDGWCMGGVPDDDRSVISGTILIMGFANNRHAREALSQYLNCVDLLKPYTYLLYLCSVPADVYGEAASILVAGNNLEQTIQQIMDMGGGNWDKETVTRALRAAYNNPERAVDYLYSGIPEAAEIAVPVARSGGVNPSTETGVAGAAPLLGVPNSSPLNMFPQVNTNF